MFCRHPRLPIDIVPGLYQLEKESKPYAAYADKLRAQLAHAYDLASKAMQKRAENNKKLRSVCQRKRPRGRRWSAGSEFKHERQE